MAGGALFPLPSNFFPSMELSAQEAASFQEWGDRLLQETVDAYHRDQLDSRDQKERKWKALKQRGSLTAFRRRKSAGDDDYKYLCTGVIDGTLDEVVRGRYADNTDDFRRVSAVYREDLVDCAVLHTIERESPARPFYYSGFKWMTVQSPGKGLVKNRDVCWYEQVGLTRDRNGKEIGYTLTESVDLPNCPTFSDCVRAKLSVCYLYRRNKSGGVKVYMRGRNNAGGKVMDYIADQKSAELWLRVDRTMAVTQAAIATAFVELSKSTPRMNFEKKKCEICEDRIGTIMSSTKQCAMCHRFTCARCIVKKRVLSPLLDFKAVCRDNFCKKCLRYISDVNLRDPQSLHDVWHFATSSPGDSAHRSYVRQFESDNGTDSSRDTDDSAHAPSSRTRSVAESVSSDGSDRSFRQLPPPPTIAAKPMQLKQHQLPPTMQPHVQSNQQSSNSHHKRYAPSSSKKKSSTASSIASSASSSTSTTSRNPSHRPPPPPPPSSAMHLLHQAGIMPCAPVTLYDDGSVSASTPRKPSSRALDAYGNPRHHVPQYAGSPVASVASSKTASEHAFQQQQQKLHHAGYAGHANATSNYYGQPSFESDYSYAQTTSTRSTSSAPPSEYAAESYQPLTTSALQGHNSQLSTQRSYELPAAPSANGGGGYTPDAMMAQMIKMNIMAENAQAMVERNDRVARSHHGGGSSGGGGGPSSNAQYAQRY